MCEVSKHNFAATFPQIETAIKNCDFVAIDLEFSGLSLSREEYGSLFDDGVSRYKKLRRSVSEFTITQIGFSAFVKQRSTDNTYEAYTFNSYLFPCVFGKLDTRFLCQASCLQFMCRYKFDFNKHAYEGVSFLNEEDERILKTQLSRSPTAYSEDRITDEQLVQSCCSLVAEWLVKADGDSCLLVDVPEGLSDYTLLIQLRSWFSNIWTELNNDNQVKVIKVSLERRKELEIEGEAMETDRFLDKMLGFTRVFRLLLQHKKPLVGHNTLMDLMFLHDKFYRRLPANYKTFKDNIHKMFPIVIDTKHIANSVRRSYAQSGIMEDTGLSQLYNSLQSDKGRYLSLFSPQIVHAEGHSRYRDLHCPHEAGYDAYMCGYVFLRLAHIIAAKDTRSMDAKPLSFRVLMLAVKPFCNRINLMRASVNAIRLDGADPASDLPPWLYVTSLRHKAPLSVGQLSQLISAFGSADIELQDPHHAVVVMRSHRAAEEVLTSLRSRSDMHITWYSFWRHSATARYLFWAGVVVVVSSSAGVWTLWWSKVLRSP